jgi:hypothetical protein
MTDTVWRCEQLRFGQVYSSLIFDSQEEAEAFVDKVQQAVPDQIFRIEPVEAKQLWN